MENHIHNYGKMPGGMTMQLPTVGLCFGTVHQADLVEMIEVAAQHGFPTLQVPPDLYFACRDAGMSAAALRKRLSDAGVRAQLIDAITTGIPGMRSEPVVFKGRTMPRWNAQACLEANDALEIAGAQPVALSGQRRAARRDCRSGRRGEPVGGVAWCYPGARIRPRERLVPDIRTAQAYRRGLRRGQ